MTTTTFSSSASTTSTVSRFAPLSGAAFVVLLVAHSTLALDGLPSIGAPTKDVVRYVTEKQSEIQLGAYLQGLAMVAFLWFHASLFQRLRSSEPGPARLSLVVLAGAIGTVALLGIHISLMTVLALRGDQLGADVVTFAWVLTFLVLGMSSFTVSAIMLPAGILILRSRVLPGWLGIGALVDAALWLVGGMSAASTADIWGAIGMISFLVWLAWILVASIALVRGTASGTDTTRSVA
jgi:hypothetical protein